MANKTENRTINMWVNGKQVKNQIGSMEAAYRHLGREVKGLERGSAAYNAKVKQMKQLKGTIDQHRSAIRNVQTRWQKLSGIVQKFAPIAVGAMAGAALMRAIRGAINTITEYQDANAKLAAVLGVTRQETQKLQEQQVALGSSTAFTAGEVANAQTELAKLGKTEREIINLTPAVLDLAAASGTDLPNAAKVAAETLNQFGLGSEKTTDVVDIMAKSFSSSSLDIEKFATAMSAAGPVAAAVGLDLQRTTALIGTLTDRGLDASTAGTSLRNIFLDLKKAGLEYDEAMNMIKNSTDQVTAANDLFGKRGATTAVILANNAEAAGDLELKLRDAAGAAREMAEVQLDTLAGDFTKLSSAYEGFILNLENGDGALAKASRRIIQFGTDFLSTLSLLETTGGDAGFSIFDILNPFSGDFGLEKVQKLAAVKQMEALKKVADEIASDGDLDEIDTWIEKLTTTQSNLAEGTLQFNLYNNEIARLKQLRADTEKQNFLDTFASPETPGGTGGGVRSGGPNAVQIDPKVLQAQLQADQIIAVAMETKGKLLQIERELGDAQLATRDANFKASQLIQEKGINESIATLATGAQEFQQVFGLLDEGLRGLLGSQGGDLAAFGGFAFQLAQTVVGLNQAMSVSSAAASVKFAATPFDYIAQIGLVIGKTLAVFGSIKGFLKDTPAPPAFATGTDSAPGGLSLVGEQGPEFVNLPEGSSVTPAGPSRNLIFGSNPQLDFAGVPDLSGAGSGGSNAMLRELQELRAAIGTWPTKLRVQNVQSDFDEYTDRRNANLRRVRNVKA